MAIKITIEQIDIEQAIKDHIGSMMEIKPDAQLDIDLSATRGSAGFTATILIRNADEVAREGTATTATRSTPQPEPVAEAAPVATTSGKVDGRTKAAKALNIPKANEKTQSTETVTQTSDTADLPVETVKETPVDNVVDAADASDEAQAELSPASSEEAGEVASGDLAAQEEAEQPAEATEAAPRASLFSGLNKPKN